ncbi:MAG TPA: MMPL family transporter, partial [Jatrophihabitans sp.]
MLTRLADLGIRAPRRVLGIAALFFVLAAAYGVSAAAHLSSGGFTDPSASSTKAATLLQQRFHTGDPNLILEVTAPDSANSPDARTEGLALVDALHSAQYTSAVASYWTAPRQAAATLISKDGKSALVLARVAGDDGTAPKRVTDITAPLVGTHNGVTVTAGGQGTVFSQVNDQTTKDLAIAEAIAIPLTVIALIWVFGSFIAALLPLVVGLSSIIGTMAVLRAIASITDVSIYALNMTTAMGLALAIDYSLFIVSRYREEVRGGLAPDDAVRRTMQTAGRTVLFSALTVGLSLAAMLAFPLYFLRSFAYAGIAVVAFAAIAALAILPAVLTLLAGRHESLDVRAWLRRVLHRPEPMPKTVEESFWYRFAQRVMARAVPVGIVVVALLVFVGLPFLHVKFGFPDQRVLPRSASAYQVGQDVDTNFAANSASTINVVIPKVGAAQGQIGGYAAQLSRVSGVLGVQSVAGEYAGGHRVGAGSAAMAADGSSYLVLATASDPQSAAAKQALSAVEAVPAPFHVWFGGQAAE